MTSLDSLNKQKAEHLKKYPSHAMLIKDYDGTNILMCAHCGGTWQSFDKMDSRTGDAPKQGVRRKV